MQKDKKQAYANKLDKALNEYATNLFSESDRWAFDERDAIGTNIDPYLQKHGIKPPRKWQEGIGRYKQITKAADAMRETADDLAYTNRTATTHQQVGMAKDR